MNDAKKNKVSYRKSNILILLSVILIVLISVGLGFAYKYNQKTTDRWPQKPRPDVANVLTLEGIVTMKRSSCGATSLYPEEDVSRYDICDSGHALRVDNKFISTSTGGPGPGYYVNTDSVKLGDTVLVKYVTNEYGGASLNCSRCSVTVTKVNGQ
jgi:hypothetical protein